MVSMHSVNTISFLIFLQDWPLRVHFHFSLQVNVAFNIVYETGLNEYALYLDCEGGQRFHRGYEFAMRHLFKMFKKQLHTYKVP